MGREAVAARDERHLLNGGSAGRPVLWRAGRHTVSFLGRRGQSSEHLGLDESLELSGAECRR